MICLMLPLFAALWIDQTAYGCGVQRMPQDLAHVSFGNAMRLKSCGFIDPAKTLNGKLSISHSGNTVSASLVCNPGYECLSMQTECKFHCNSGQWFDYSTNLKTSLPDIQCHASVDITTPTSEQDSVEPKPEVEPTMAAEEITVPSEITTTVEDY